MSDSQLVKINPITAIVCDDVRIEDNGKHIIIGVYTGDMTINGMPAENEQIKSTPNVFVFLWMLLEMSEKGFGKAEVRIVGPLPSYKCGAKFGITVEEPMPYHDLLPFPIGPFPLRIWESGNIQIEFRNEGDEWQTIRNLKVIYN